MKAAVFKAVGQIEVKELPMPEPKSGEVRLKVLGCGVCGTDAHIFTGHIQNANPPVVLGHEIYGEVDKLGDSVEGIEIGDRVVVDPFIFCGVCQSCKQGKYRFCRNEEFIGYHHNGGFAQYTVAPAANVYIIESSVDFKEAVLAETLSTILAGVSKLLPEAGRTILLLGAGTVGLLWNQVLRGSLAVSVVQTDLVAMRRERANILGADRVLHPSKEDLAGSVFKLCPNGVDYLVDATGSTEAITQALPLLARGGTFLSFGICPENEQLSLSLNWLYKQQVRIITSRRPPREMQRAVSLLERRILSVGNLVTGIYSLDDIERAFVRFNEAKDEEIKMMIDPWQ